MKTATVTTNKPASVNSIAIVHYSTTAPTTTALNRTASATAAAAASATRDAARLYNTVLQAKGTAVGKAISLLNQTGTAIRRFGMACPTGGYYVPVKHIPDVQNIYDDALLALDDLRDEILATYADITAGVRQRLGKFADQVTIPTATEVASKFTMSLRVLAQPMPLDGPVLAGLANEVANRVRAESAAQIEADLKAAHSGPIADLKSCLQEFSDRLRNAERLHMTQFDKLADEIKRVRQLNILDLPELEDLAQHAERAVALRDRVNADDNDSRVAVAVVAETAAQRADATLAAFGL
jgi:hypothetical protein